MTTTETQTGTQTGTHKVRPEFGVHLLNDRGIENAAEMSIKFSHLTDWLEDVCLQGREWAIVKTKLEEASFFAKKAMAIKPENQKEAQ